MFIIYDRNGNNYSYITTDRFGEAVFRLPYGTFRIEQLTTTDGYFKVDDKGNMTANSGKIGGWDIGEHSLSAGRVSLSDNGKMVGSTWSIDENGKASFSDMNISGGSLTLGGTTIDGSGTSFSSGTTTIDHAYTLHDYIETLAIGTLTANNINSAFTESTVLKAPVVQSSGINLFKTASLSALDKTISLNGGTGVISCSKLEINAQAGGKWVSVKGTDNKTYQVLAVG
jgi:hypothetical protein